jgi:Protein of unknown function (DUF2971)
MFAPLVEEGDLPEDLYHYTDGGGLLGILNDCTLWATHAAYLNDAQETTYGLDNVLKELKKLGLEPTIPPELSGDELWPPQIQKQGWLGAVGRWITVKILIAAVETLAKDRIAFLQQYAGPFVTCLSEERDRLSQWRGYSGDGGYAIRFDANALRASVKDNEFKEGPDHPSLGPMEMGARYVTKMRYSTAPDFIRAGLLSFFRTLLQHVSSKYSTGGADVDEKSFREAGQQIVRESMAWILGIAVQTKNPGFEEENEYRILTFDDPDRYYPKAIGLVPRVFIKFDPSCVQEIMVGPGANLDLRKSSIEYYRNMHMDYSHVEVSESSTPFRGT